MGSLEPMTLTVDEFNTAAKLVRGDGKDRANACRPFLEMNLVRYASLKYNYYMANIGPPPPLPSVKAEIRQPVKAGRSESGMPPFPPGLSTIAYACSCRSRF